MMKYVMILCIYYILRTGAFVTGREKRTLSIPKSLLEASTHKYSSTKQGAEQVRILQDKDNPECGRAGPRRKLGE